MADPHSIALARAEARLADVHMEQRRQMEYVGVRLGVFRRLRELEREERRVSTRIERLRAKVAESHS